MKYSEKRVDNPQYLSQQRYLSEIAKELGVVKFKPNYHGWTGDCNTVLFYTEADHQRCIKLDREGVPCDAPHYPRQFWSFENTDKNGHLNYGFANYGKIDLRGSDWKKKLRAAVMLPFLRKQENDYLVAAGGVCGLREADEWWNDHNRSIIAAYRDLYGAAYIGKTYLGSVNEMITEFTGQMVYNFGADFVIPVWDNEVERLIIEYRKYTMGRTLIDLQNRIEEIGGKLLIWK